MTFGSDGLFCNSRGLPEGSTRYRRAAGQGKWRRLGTPARPFFCFCFTGPFTPAFAQCPFLLVFPTKNGHFEEAPSCLLSPHQYSPLCSSLPRGGCGHPRSGQNRLPGQDVGKVWVYVCTLTLQPDRCLSELGHRPGCLLNTSRPSREIRRNPSPCPKPGPMGCAWNANLISHPTLCLENHSLWDFSVTVMGPLGQENYSQKSDVKRPVPAPAL